MRGTYPGSLQKTNKNRGNKQQTCEREGDETRSGATTISENIPRGLLDVQPVLHDHVEEVNIFPRKINCYVRLLISDILIMIFNIFATLFFQQYLIQLLNLFHAGFFRA